jgi:hypothetical protein
MLAMIREDVGPGSDYSSPAKQRSNPIKPESNEVAIASQPLFLTVNVEGQQPKKKAVVFERDATGAVIGMKTEDAE